MNSTREIILDLYLNFDDMSREEVHSYLNNVGIDAIKIETDARALVKKLRVKNKIKKGEAYVNKFKELLSVIKNGQYIDDMEEDLQSEIQFQYNKLKNLNEEDIFEKMEDITKLKLMKYFKKHFKE